MTRPTNQTPNLPLVAASVVILALTTGVLGFALGRSAGTTAVAPARIDLSEIHARFDEVDRRLHDLGQPLEGLPSTRELRAPSASTVERDLEGILERIDGLRQLMIPENRDLIPPDLRIEKRPAPVTELATLLDAGRWKDAKSIIFGLTRAQVYRALGEPDSVMTTPNGVVHWIYVPSNDYTGSVWDPTVPNTPAATPGASVTVLTPANPLKEIDQARLTNPCLSQ